MRMKLAVAVMIALAAIAVSGASGADFETDDGPCPEWSLNAFLLLCPTAYVGEEYEVELESEDGSGCEPYDWFEIKNGSLPGGLSMTRDGVISGTPAGGPGSSRFWVWNHDLTFAEGGPDWCQREDRSEKEFIIFVEPGLEIATEELEPATLGQPYSQTLTARDVLGLTPPSYRPVEASWKVLSGTLPPGMTLSAAGVLTGTSTSEGSYQFVARAQRGTPVADETYTLSVRQPLVVRSPFGSTQRANAEVGLRLAKTVTATGGSGTYTWSVSSGALPAGLALDETKGTLTGTPRAAGNFAFGLSASDSEGRVTTANIALRVAPRLAIRPLPLKSANVGRAYRATLATVGGVAPMTWTVVRGKLPAGLRLSRSLGTLTGAPSRVGTHRVAIEARDVLGARSRTTFALVVNA
jgi:large repetitive protein